MKTRLLQILALSLLAVAPSRAQEQPAELRPPEQLDELFGPIALYPDALIAIILPASTVPSDIVMAARFLEKDSDLGKIDAEPWDDSVKSLAHYPDVIKWMDQNLAWTKQAGEAFVAQPADVMNAVQRLRTKARAAGTLIDTPQQRIVIEDSSISIVPAEPDVIYVPSYDPEIVYVSQPRYYADPFITFGVGYAAGFWLGYDLDWRRHRIWCIDRNDRERYWRGHHDWRHRAFPGRPGYVDNGYRHRSWTPSTHFHRPSRSADRSRPNVARPSRINDRSPGYSHDVGRRTPDRTPGDRSKRPTSASRDHSQNRRTDNRAAVSSQRPAAAVTPLTPQASAPVTAGRTQSPSSSPQRFHRDSGNRGTTAREAKERSIDPRPSSPQVRAAASSPPQSSPAVRATAPAATPARHQTPARVAAPDSAPVSRPAASVQSSAPVRNYQAAQSDRSEQAARSQGHSAQGQRGRRSDRE